MASFTASNSVQTLLELILNYITFALLETRCGTDGRTAGPTLSHIYILKTLLNL